MEPAAVAVGQAKAQVVDIDDGAEDDAVVLSPSPGSPKGATISDEKTAERDGTTKVVAELEKVVEIPDSKPETPHDAKERADSPPAASATLDVQPSPSGSTPASVLEKVIQKEKAKEPENAQREDETAQEPEKK